MSRSTVCSCGGVIDRSARLCPHCGRRFHLKGVAKLFLIGSILFGAFLILFMSFLFAFARSKEENKPIIPSSAQLQNELTTEEFKVHVRTVEFTNKIENGESTVVAEGRFQIVEADITNIAPSYRYVSSYSFAMVDSEGEEYLFSREAQELYETKNGTPSITDGKLLEAGGHITVRLIFDVPLNTPLVMKFGSGIGEEGHYLRVE